MKIQQYYVFEIKITVVKSPIIMWSFLYTGLFPQRQLQRCNQTYSIFLHRSKTKKLKSVILVFISYIYNRQLPRSTMLVQVQNQLRLSEEAIQSDNPRRCCMILRLVCSRVIVQLSMDLWIVMIYEMKME
ncbi:Hypothetical_protein [Hexamita inflata]|uniref:Hypothetical_protein n=1 Tax=Hexamita inflata TaxID=28002 RepID=A0AA86N719_9EUKA|nr:Hypothetical protein HINF_LOCUS1887 [Hexamita inflata]